MRYQSVGAGTASDRSESTRAEEWTHPSVTFGTFCSEGQNCTQHAGRAPSLSTYSVPVSQICTLLFPPCSSLTKKGQLLASHPQVWTLAAAKQQEVRHKQLLLSSPTVHPLHSNNSVRNIKAEQRKNQKVIFQSAFCTGHCYSVSVHSKMEIHNCNSLHCRETEFLKRSYFTHSQLPEFLINAFLDIFLTQSKKCNSSKTLQDKLTYKSFDFHPRRNLFSFGLNSFKIPDMINTVK